MPGFDGDLLEVVVEQICHKFEALGEKSQFEGLLCISQHLCEAFHCFGMESLAIVAPLKWVCKRVIPLVHERVKGGFELFR